MLQRAFVQRNGMLVNRQVRAFGSVAHSRIPQEKDYYQVLGIDNRATGEQIKEAYREAVKKYHPDLKGSSAGDSSKFRDVMEAYGILSVRESRVNYDLHMRKHPEQYRKQSQEDSDRQFDISKRDDTGSIRAAPEPGSYAEQRMKDLAEQRKQYNVNHIGYYRGGVPQKGKGLIRGSALDIPGAFHDPKVHNRLNFFHPDSKIINSEDAVKFKTWMNSDKWMYNQTKPSYPMYYDKEMLFNKDRRFWLSLILGILGALYVGKKIPYEIARWRRNDRMSNIQEAPAHHFNNRGGVLVKKKFIGFEKYHKNGDELMEWYHKAYPNVIGEEK